ncbi:MAG: S8 family serine peptidase, partial [Bdellovibrionales bacterium]|nr:S8 family serine peptidase [Bdellovibrionales bacterium]
MFTIKQFGPIFLALLSIIAVSSESAQAEEGTVYQGQYILRRLSSDKKQDLLLDFVENFKSEDFVVAHSIRKAVLLRTDEIESTDVSAIVSDDSERFCAKLRRSRRDAEKKHLRNVPSRIVCVPNELVSVSRSPNDSYTSIQYALDSLNMYRAWDISTGLERLSMVAVVDTGVDLDHSDLYNRLWVNPGEIPNNGIDDDGNGYVDDVHGYDFHNNDGRPDDGHGHGTHCAGVIGAQTNNSLGMAGMNWSTQIVAVKVLDDSGSGSMYNVLQGITYVNVLKEAGFPIHSSNYSLGGGPYYSAYVNEITRAMNNDIMFVAAAGNASSNNDSVPAYPASYNVPNVISVAAIDSADKLASFSNFGATTVHIGAPGVDIASTYKDNRYVYMSGTSMAAPQVAGIVSLAHAYSGADYATIKSTLFSTGKSVSALQGKTTTGVKPDVFKLLQQLDSNGDVSPTPPPPGNGSSPTPTPTMTPTPAPSVSLSPTPTPTATPVPSPFPVVLNITTIDAITEAALPGTKLQLLDYYNTQTVLGEGNSSGEATARFDLTGPLRLILKASRDGYRDLVVEDSMLTWTNTDDSRAKSYVAKIRPLIHKVIGTVVNDDNQVLSGAIVEFNAEDV